MSDKLQFVDDKLRKPSDKLKFDLSLPAKRVGHSSNEGWETLNGGQEEV